MHRRVLRTPVGCMALAVGVALSGGIAPAQSGAVSRHTPTASVPVVPISELAGETAAGSAPMARAAESSDVAIPPYFFGPLKLTGAVLPDSSAVDLTAHIEVHLTRSDEGLYDVPLRLNQAYVLGMSYQGPHEPSPRPASPARDDGLHWLFTGQGVHHLTLNLRAPLQSTANGNRLQLSLPTIPKQFATQLSLDIPGDNLTVTPESENLVRRTTVTNGVTHVQAEVAGTRLDLNWRSNQARTGTISRSETAFTLDRSGGNLRLRARQVLTADGSVSEAFVRLPSQFSLAGVKALSGTGYVSHELSMTDLGWIRVQVRPDSVGQVEFNWELVTDFPIDGREILVDGLEVRGALRQSGSIGVAPIRGFQVSQPTDASANVLQRVATSAAWSPSPFLLTAYQFLQQPFALRLDVRPLQPSITTRPRWVLSFAEDHVDLDVDAAIRVDAGVVQNLSLDWPSGGGDGWMLVSHDPALEVDDAMESERDGRQWIRLTEPRDSDFRLQLRYRQDLTAPQFDLALPQVTSNRTLPGWLIVRGSDAIEATVRTAGTMGVTPLSDVAADEWLEEMDFEPEQQSGWRVSSAAPVISGDILTHQRDVQAEALLFVEDSSTDRLAIRQWLNFDVRYGRISDLQLAIPPDFPPIQPGAENAALQVTLSDGASLPLTLGDEVLLVEFPEAMRGKFSVHLQYALTRRPGASRLDLPVFLPRDTSVRGATVEFPRDSTVQITPTDPQWKPVATAIENVWVSTTPQARFSAELRDDVRSAPHSYQVESALARVSCQASAYNSVVVDYRLKEAPATLVIGLPLQASQAHFEWNGRVLSDVSPNRTPGELGYKLVVPPVAGNADAWLRVAYQLPRSGSLTWGTCDVALPTLPQNVPIHQSYIEVALPRSHNLLTYPLGMSPLFDWRSTPIWQREPTEEYLAFRPQLIAPRPEADSEGASARDRLDALNQDMYPFRTSSRAEGLQFRVISLWMLILIGAGTTLGLSFLLWSVPATRSILTMLIACFLLSLAGVFAAEMVELLMQPALLGLGAASAAILMHVRGAPVRRVPGRDSATPRSGVQAVPSPPLSSRNSDSGAESSGYASTQLRPLSLRESGSHS